VERVQVLIAGGGIAGLSAAIWCERLGLSCVLVEKGDRLGGQLSDIHNQIWDFPPRVYPDGAALLDELLAHRSIRALRPRLGEALRSVDLDEHLVHTDKAVYRADYLIIATGVRPNRIPALAGCSRVLPPWFSTTSQGTAVAGQDVAVIGGGDRAVESACNLLPHVRSLYLLVRSDRLRARPQWVERLHPHPSLHVLWETVVSDCREQNGKAVLTLDSPRPGTPQTLVVDWVLPRIGVRGNIDGLGQLPALEGGYLQADVNQQVGADWVYAIGDVANGAAYASLSLAVGQAMKAVKHISLQVPSP
jgi:thioredoxin reductase (NADPH)